MRILDFPVQNQANGISSRLLTALGHGKTANKNHINNCGRSWFDCSVSFEDNYFSTVVII